MTRFAATMVLLSVVFWFTSRPPIPLGRDFPNCVSARADSSVVAIGVLSINGVSTLFVTREALEPGRSTWSERADFHFCGFPVPTSTYGAFDCGVLVRLSMNTIGWDCPYWLMTLLWLGVATKYWTAWQYRSLDVLYFMTVVAIVIACFQSHFTLPLVVFCNLTTAMLLVVLSIGTFRWFWRSPNPLWPIAIGTVLHEDEPKP